MDTFTAGLIAGVILCIAVQMLISHAMKKSLWF